MEITEDEQTGTVTIDEFIIPGWVGEEPCPTCGEEDVYHERFDAYFCPRCNAWLESRCGDSGCGYCADRPPYPLPLSRNSTPLSGR